MNIGRLKRLMPAVMLALLTLALALLLPAVSIGAAPTRNSPPDFAAINAYVDGQMRELRIPGLALGIVQGDQIVHLQGFGMADPSGRPVTPQTPFMIGSVTKSFTALAIMQLVEQGKVDLDAPIQRYLPWFRVADEAASAQITVQHLLHQTSGLSRATGNQFQPVSGLPTSQDEAMRAIFAATKDWDAQSAEFLASPATNYQVRAAGTLGDRPLYILTATDHGTPPEQEQLWQAWQQDLSSLSTNSAHQIVAGANHASLWANEANAHLSAAAIVQVVEAARTGQALAP